MKFLLVVLFSFQAYSATPPKECGTFAFTGVIEKNQNATGYSFVTDKGTRSEFNFPISDEDELKAAPYIDRPVKITAKILKPMTSFQGKFDQIEKFELVVPDPAKIKGEPSYSLVKKEKCK